MPWFYSQSSGNLSLNGQFVATGYSGHGEGCCNPTLQDDAMVGPIPRGIYTIGAEFTDPEKGPLVMHLLPAPQNTMFGRSGFLIHGDNAQRNRSASEGCIILDHPFRQQISDSQDRQLIVTE
jgi:hypothetical protein